MLGRKQASESRRVDRRRKAQTGEERRRDVVSTKVKHAAVAGGKTGRGKRARQVKVETDRKGWMKSCVGESVDRKSARAV